jgi:hypothetical protein
MAGYPQYKHSMPQSQSADIDCVERLLESFARSVEDGFVRREPERSKD